MLQGPFFVANDSFGTKGVSWWITRAAWLSHGFLDPWRKGVFSKDNRCLDSWNFHHVNMALVGGPMFLSNNMHTPIIATHGKSPSLQTRWAFIAIHTIFNKGKLMVFPITAWLSHNKQLIRTKMHKWHNPYHNSLLDYFPMSYKFAQNK